MVLLLLPTQKP